MHAVSDVCFRDCNEYLMWLQSEKATPLHIFTTSLKKEGPQFLFKGWTPAFVRLGPNTVLLFVFLEVSERLRRDRVSILIYSFSNLRDFGHLLVPSSTLNEVNKRIESRHRHVHIISFVSFLRNIRIMIWNRSGGADTNKSPLLSNTRRSPFSWTTITLPTIHFFLF